MYSAGLLSPAVYILNLFMHGCMHCSLIVPDNSAFFEQWKKNWSFLESRSLDWSGQACPLILVLDCSWVSTAQATSLFRMRMGREKGSHLLLTTPLLQDNLHGGIPWSIREKRKCERSKRAPAYGNEHADDGWYSGKARIIRDNIYPPLDSLWRYIRFLRTWRLTSYYCWLRVK